MALATSHPQFSALFGDSFGGLSAPPDNLCRRPFPLTVAQGVGDAHFFLSCSNSVSLGSPVSPSPAAIWNLRIASRVAGPSVP